MHNFLMKSYANYCLTQWETNYNKSFQKDIYSDNFTVYFKSHNSPLFNPMRTGLCETLETRGEYSKL